MWHGAGVIARINIPHALFSNIFIIRSPDKLGANKPLPCMSQSAAKAAVLGVYTTTVKK